MGLYQSDYGVYRRDFEHGTVLLNGSNAPYVFSLPSGTYRRIAGTQNVRNDGTLLTGSPQAPVVVPPMDGLIVQTA